ncbi:hypothetical protein [Subtercola sp. Z020]|uniref:hypothetical protein n=1 Tax=Subtercola sp. Z020 TaxID=2080582 RepID=UPI0011B0852D|nr:hypothetical protein [Subtercola sp. Z020]
MVSTGFRHWFLSRRKPSRPEHRIQLAAHRVAQSNFDHADVPKERARELGVARVERHTFCHVTGLVDEPGEAIAAEYGKGDVDV